MSQIIKMVKYYRQCPLPVRANYILPEPPFPFKPQRFLRVLTGVHRLSLADFSCHQILFCVFCFPDLCWNLPECYWSAGKKTGRLKFSLKSYYDICLHTYKLCRRTWIVQSFSVCTCSMKIHLVKKWLN